MHSKIAMNMGLCIFEVQMSDFLLYMWQSSVEIEGYSIVYFDHIAAFEVTHR